MKKLIYKTKNHGVQTIDLPEAADDHEGRIVDSNQPEVGDLVRITRMHEASNDTRYIGKVGTVVAIQGSGEGICMQGEILVGDVETYVKGWEILARKGEII